MKKMKVIVAVLAFSLTSAVMTTAQATEQKDDLFVNLTTDATWAATKTIMLTHQNVLKHGHKPVEICLNVRRVYLVNS